LGSLNAVGLWCFTRGAGDCVSEKSLPQQEPLPTIPIPTFVDLALVQWARLSDFQSAFFVKLPVFEPLDFAVQARNCGRVFWYATLHLGGRHR
jgi:hypothetical protein